MPGRTLEVHDLDSWLQRIISLHPEEIELGLDRIQAVANRMGLTKLANKVVTVAGTCLLYTSPSPRDLSTSRMPSSA